ncbi:uncharacterized protein zbbx [Chaetodon auriga]|uniref:uncharacterized protein zbbx n=1 Tax=Chaetodon auriga TaxID=39042 RepID=UPI0040331468
MNLNDFVVLPNNKAKSVKLNARNLQELQMETVTLAQDSKEMEEKLQQLKERMSKEKEERRRSGWSRWKSGHCGSLTSTGPTSSTEKNKNRLEKLSAGKVKIRVLKDEPLTAPPQPPPPPPPPTIGIRATRKNRLRGRYCGQCEVRSAGLMCVECTEDYCIGCFARFHQKGALKLHRMIPIQADLQTHVSTQDVVSCFQEQINPCSNPGTFTSLDPGPSSKPSPNHTIKSKAITRQGDHSSEKRTEAVAKPTQLHPDSSQELAVNHGEEKMPEITEEEQKKEVEWGFPGTLLRGDYNEEESARSFQEALGQWRREKSDGAEEPVTEDTRGAPVRPVSVSDVATQADPAPDRGAEGLGGGGGERRVPVRVEFTESSLTNMDRLLLKRHRRTPIETYPLLAFGTGLNPLSNTSTEEETTSSLTAEEEDFRHYFASLFAVPVSRGMTEPQITTPESCLIIEVLDERERDTDGDVAEQRTSNRELPSVQQVLSKGRTPAPQTALTSGRSSRVSYLSPSPTQPSRQSTAPAQPKAAHKLHLSKPQPSQAEPLMKPMSSESKPSACPTDTPRTSKTSIKTPTWTSQKPNCSPMVNKSKPVCGSPQLLSSPSLSHSQTEISKSSDSAVSFARDVSPLAHARPPIPEEHPSPSPSISLRSTFTMSPTSSFESTLLPKVYQSTPLQKDSSLLPEQRQSSPLFPEPISSLKLSHSTPSNQEFSRQSQQSLCDPETLISDTQLQLPLSPVSPSPNPPPESLEPSPPVKALSALSLFNESPPDAHSRQRSTPTHEHAPVFMSSTLNSVDHRSNAQCTPSLPSHLLNIIQTCPLAVKMEEEEELSVDSGDEMSSDSLGLLPREDDSSDEEAQMHGRLTRGSSGEEQQGNPAISHLQDCFVPADVEREKDLQTDEQEQLSEPSTVMHKQSAGSKPEQFCDLDGFPPLALDMNSDQSDTPEQTYCDSLHSSQTSLYDSDPTGSQGFWPSASLSTYAEEHLVFRMMKDNRMQPTRIQIHSTTPTRPTSRREISANEAGTSGSNRSEMSTPTQFPVAAACCLFSPTLGSELGPAFRPLSRAAQEIVDICSVDQTGCEDPDLDTDTTAHTIYELEQELKLMTKETGQQASIFEAGSGGSQDQHESHHFTWGGVSEEQKDEDAAAQRDQQSVLLLP